MNRYQCGVMAGMMGAMLALPSCGELNQPLSSNGGAMLMAPGLAPGGMTRGGLGRRDFHAIHIGQATEAQRRLATQRAQVALRSDTTRRKLKEKNVKYVAVAVKREKSQQQSAGKTVMKVNAETGKPTGEVFAAANSSGLKEGDTIKLGGDPTMYFASAGDRM